MSKEWSNERTLQFLELYASERVIWDPNNKNHKFKHKIKEAWKRISEKFDNVPVLELKSKRKSLMATFRPLMKKKMSSMRAGADGDDIIQPIWFAFDLMESFLGPLYEDVEVLNTDIEPQDENEMLPLATIDVIEDPIKQENNNEANSNEIDKNNILLSSPPKKRTYLNTKAEAAQIKINESFDTLNHLLKGQDSDECDLYAKLLAKRLKRYPENMQQIIMYKIDGLLLSNPYPSERPVSSSSSLSYQVQSTNNHCSNSCGKHSQDLLQTNSQPQLKIPIKSEKHRINVLSQDITLPGTSAKIVGTAFLNTMEDDNTDDSM